MNPSNKPDINKARSKIQQLKNQFEQRKQLANSLEPIKTKIGVYSGKGGVGKTSVTVNLALALSKMGYNPGIFDVDIDCPNITKALGITSKPSVDDLNRMIPPELHGIKVMSMGFFQKNEDEAIIFRGPMIHNAINQLLSGTNWEGIDILLVDLPPGTSDAPLTVMQTLDLDGFVVVTTPQELAKLDAIRSINMIKKLNHNIYGVVENFTGEYFGTGAGKEISKELEIDFLGNIEMRKSYSDRNKIAYHEDMEANNEYNKLASNLIQKLS
jgi:ATP-binding protein involved in chromosome partitioning